MKWFLPIGLFVCCCLCAAAVRADGRVGRISDAVVVARVAVGGDGKLYAWDKAGQALPGWPKDLAASGRYFAYGPRLIDLDLDQQEEVVAVSAAVGGGTLQLHVFKGNGAELPSWHFDIPHDDPVETPIIADVNHDSSLDIAYATRAGGVYVYRRNFSAAPNFAKQLGGAPRLVAGDPDNNGLTDLFAAAGRSVVTWDETGNLSTLFTLPEGEEIIGNVTITDIDRDGYPDLLFSTTGDRIVAIDRHGTVLLNIRAPDGVHLVSEVLVADIDVDQQPELIVVTNTGQVLAYEVTGAAVTSWRYRLGFRAPPLVSGIVADDRYTGLFTTVTGADQTYLYRTRHNSYARVALGEHVREWDTFANFDFLQTIAIEDLFTFPKPFTPNGDGVNDTALVHYRLSAAALVALDLYDAHEHYLSRIHGRESRAAGEHQEIWNGMDTRGTVTPKDDAPLDTGLYILKIVAESPEGFVSVAKVSAIVNGVKAEIETPKEDYQKVFGIVSISGIATDPNFGEGNLDADFRAYKLYYRPGVWAMTDADILSVGQTGSGWLPLEVPLQHQCSAPEAIEPNDSTYPHSNVSCRPVQHGVLGKFDTTDLAKVPNGDYTVLLKVMDSNGNTVGKVHYDARIVTVANPNPKDPFDPANPYDPNNPQNPIYLGPKIGNTSLTNPLITLTNPSTVIAYTLANETANIHITIYPADSTSATPTAAIYSFNHVAPNDPGNPQYVFTWNGTNTLGRHVPGGHYRVRITADAVDGTGVDVNEALSLDVAKGFAASDTLGVATDTATGKSMFTATPSHFDPLGFSGSLQPEKTSLAYALTKEAKVTLQVLDDVGGKAGTVRKTLLSGIVQKYDNGATYWDGAGDNGVILPVGKDYHMRLTAESIDIGNEGTITQELIVHLDAATLNGGLPADITQLNGADGETATDDGPLTTMTGNPDFLWRAVGTGIVDIPFQYEITGYATNQYTYKEQQVKTGVGWPVMKVCQYYSDCGVLGFDSCQDHVTPLSATPRVDLPSDFSFLPPPQAVSDNASHPAMLVDWHSKGTLVTGQVQAGGAFDPGDWISTTDKNGWSTTVIALSGCSEPQNFHGYPYPYCYPPPRGCFDQWGMPAPCPPPPSECVQQDVNKWPCNEQGNLGVLWECGITHLNVFGEVSKTATCTSPAVTMSSTGELASTQGGGSAGKFSGNLETCDGKDVIPGTKTNQNYRLQLQDQVNGITSTDANNGQANAGYVLIPGLKGWMGNNGGPTFNADGTYNSSEAFVAMNLNLPDGKYISQRDDPYLANAPYKKIWATYKNFNNDFFHRDTRDVSIYHEGYQPNIFNGDPGANLYSFSNVVHLSSWDLDLRYPNISTGAPDGDGLADIFHLENVTVTPAGVRGTQNSNIDDHFRLRLLPEAVPRRFVEIHGSAGPNYELYYYDNNQQTPQWHAIVPRTTNPVSDGLLAHWDVTGLNGKQYTVVLKTKNGDQVNIDTMDIGIGTLVDTSKLGPNEFVRVYSTFKRAALIFGPGSLSEPRLVTITPVKKDAAAFTLPSGIAPLGPIFDIKPDNIAIDPKYHVQLELTFTPAELQEAFGVADASELTIYNLAGNELLEGLATIATLDTHDDADPSNDVWRFTADLEHFSQYFLARKTAGYIHVDTPASDAYLHGTVDIVARVEQRPRPADQLTVPQDPASLTSLAISYYPAGNPTAKQLIIANSSPQPSTALADIHVPWDVSALNGNFVLRFDAEGPQGAKVSHEVPVAIDNTPTQTTLLINGKAIADGTTVAVGIGSLAELAASDSATNAWQSGVAQIAFGIDGAALAEYTQPFALPFYTGAHTIRYRSTDTNGNVEPERSATIQIQEAMPPADATGVDVQLAITGPAYTHTTQTWVSDATTLALQATGDAVAQVMYRIGEAEPVVYGGPFSLAEKVDGHYPLEYFAVDAMGLHAAIHTQALLLDLMPPMSRLSTEGLAVLQGTTVTVAPATLLMLDALDPGDAPAGVDRIEYRLGDDVWKVYSKPFSVAVSTTLAFRVIDRVGNIETSQLYTVQIDDTPPTLGVLSAPTVISPNGDGRHDVADVVVQAADNLYTQMTLTMTLQVDSGTEYVALDHIALQPGKNTLTWDGKVKGELLPEGAYHYTITLSDAGQNAAAPYTGTLIYDTTPPEVHVVGSAVRAFSPNGDAVSDVLQVDYTIADNLFTTDLTAELQILTGTHNPLLSVRELVATPPAQHQLAWNGTNAAANGVFDGDYHFQLVAEDPAGNRSVPKEGDAESEGTVFVDRAAPVTTLAIDGPTYTDDTKKTWLGRDAHIRLTAVDPPAGSGVAAITYGLNDAAPQAYQQPFALPAEATDSQLHYSARDVVGNVEADHQRAARSDVTVPRSTLQIGDPQETLDATLHISPNTPITLTAEDPNGVGVKTIWFALTGVKDPAAYDQTMTLSGLGDGRYTLQYWAEDQLGNAEAKRTLDAMLDGTPPVTTMGIGDPQYVVPGDALDIQGVPKPIYIRSDTPIRFTAATERNDWASTEYRINDGAWQVYSADATFTLPTEGTYTITYRSTDRLQNQEVEKSQQLIVDNTPPNVGIDLSQNTIGGVHYVTPTTQVTLHATDAAASVATIEYRIGDGAFTPYTGPFLLQGFGPGTYAIQYRARDRLGNQSTTQELVTEMVDVDVTRTAFTMPRVLVFMLQTRDLRAEDPRPNADLLQRMSDELGGYVTIIDGDQNDPATVDRFLAALRSDKYTTFIFATDAYVVKFFDTPKVVNMLKELKSRIYKGDAFLSLASYSQIEGDAWNTFLADFQQGPADLQQHFVGLADRVGVMRKQYGHGQIADFHADLGRLAGSDPANGPALALGLADTVRAIMPKQEEINSNEVIDDTLTYTNHGSTAVTVHTDETFPLGWIETKKTAGEVFVATRGFDITVPAHGTAYADYLYRSGAEPGEYPIGTATHAQWADGLTSTHTFSTPYTVAHALLGLFDELIGPAGLIDPGEMPAVAEKVQMVERRLTLDRRTVQSDVGISVLVGMLLDAIDLLPSGDTNAHLVLAEIIENLGALQAVKALQLDISVGTGDPNDPTSFHGDTSAYLSGGEGGCTLIQPGAYKKRGPHE